MESANAAITEGDYDGFLSTALKAQSGTVGRQVLTGNDAVRNYMAQMYTEPPKFRVKTW